MCRIYPYSTNFVKRALYFNFVIINETSSSFFYKFSENLHENIIVQTVSQNFPKFS